MRRMPDLASQAISAALDSRWEEAVKINSQILKAEEKNVDCLNRLGRACLELGQARRATAIFRQILKLDRYNPIAQRNLVRAQQTKTTSKPVIKPTSAAKNISLDFLEEPGKTKLVGLVNLAPSSVLLKQKQADMVLLTPKRRTIIITNQEDQYLGALPDDLGHRLSFLIKGGNQYCAWTKAVSGKSLMIFIKEILRAKRFAQSPSFAITNLDYLSTVREEALEEPTGENPDDDNAGPKITPDDEEAE